MTTFTADITDCVVISVAMTPIADQYYDIYTPAITFTYATFVQTPACGYTLDYTFWEFDSVTSTYSALPAWISETAAIFTVQTNDPSFEDFHKIVVRGSVPVGYPVFQDELIVDVDIIDSCETPNLSASSLSNEVYQLHSGSLTTLDFADFLLSEIYCPITYQLAISPALPASDPNAITLDSAARTVTFLSTDTTTVNLYTLTVTALTP